MRRRPLLPGGLGPVYGVGVLAVLLGLGGLVYLSLETRGPAGEGEDFGEAAVVALCGLTASVLAGRPLWRKDLRNALRSTLLLVVLLAVTLAAAEAVGRRLVPAWPARALHGVDPGVGRRAWGRVESFSPGVGFNDWGQRDRSRALSPDPGQLRVAFVGDSMLEETPGVPLSLRVEQKIGDRGLEVINLGVSATGPDEYYHRVREVAVPLAADYCVVFLYAGNDFLDPPRTLGSFGGIAAVSPRGSFLSAIGLHALNHALTNRLRPVLERWILARNMAQEEQRMGELLRGLDDRQTAGYLLRIRSARLGPAQRERLGARLESSECAAVFRMLREPDAGLFRSYYLSHALEAAADPDAEMRRPSDQAAFHWVRCIHELCRKRQIGFLLVIVPEAFQVDSRMVEQWRPLADMARYTRATHATSQRLRQRLELLGIDVLDLHQPLLGMPGSYLNVDGHWSEQGVERVADLLVEALQARLRPGLAIR